MSHGKFWTYAVMLGACALGLNVAAVLFPHTPSLSFADRFAPVLSMPASEDLRMPARPKGNKSIQMRVV